MDAWVDMRRLLLSAVLHCARHSQMHIMNRHQPTRSSAVSWLSIGHPASQTGSGQHPDHAQDQPKEPTCADGQARAPQAFVLHNDGHSTQHYPHGEQQHRDGQD